MYRVRSTDVHPSVVTLEFTKLCVTVEWREMFEKEGMPTPNTERARVEGRSHFSPPDQAHQALHLDIHGARPATAGSHNGNDGFGLVQRFFYCLVAPPLLTPVFSAPQCFSCVVSCDQCQLLVDGCWQVALPSCNALILSYTMARTATILLGMSESWHPFQSA